MTGQPHMDRRLHDVLQHGCVREQVEASENFPVFSGDRAVRRYLRWLFGCYGVPPTEVMAGVYARAVWRCDLFR